MQVNVKPFFVNYSFPWKFIYWIPNPCSAGPCKGRIKEILFGFSAFDSFLARLSQEPSSFMSFRATREWGGPRWVWWSVWSGLASGVWVRISWFSSTGWFGFRGPESVHSLRLHHSWSRRSWELVHSSLSSPLPVPTSTKTHTCGFVVEGRFEPSNPSYGSFFWSGWGLTHSQSPALCPLCSLEHLRSPAVFYVSLHTHRAQNHFPWMIQVGVSKPRFITGDLHFSSLWWDICSQVREILFLPSHAHSHFQISRPKIFICNGFWWEEKTQLFLNIHFLGQQ